LLVRLHATGDAAPPEFVTIRRGLPKAEPRSHRSPQSPFAAVFTAVLTAVFTIGRRSFLPLDRIDLDYSFFGKAVRA